jgi:hypothetical protein
MKQLTRVVAWAAGALLVGPVAAQDIPSKPLDGFYRAEPCAGAGDRSCRFFLELRGDPARVMYEGMTSEAKPDICTGGEVKIDSDTLRCFKLGDGGYLCDVGYDFSERKFVFGDVTC